MVGEKFPNVVPNFLYRASHKKIVFYVGPKSWRNQISRKIHFFKENFVKM